jgi:excisionase family DNA binding protein
MDKQVGWEELLGLRAAAEKLGLSPTTLRIQAAKGVLQAYKIGRDWVVYPSELERYAIKHRRQSAQK